MAVFDINTLQDNGIKVSDNYAEFILQSLANLGQRLGVKGDSITTRNFSFKDLFDLDIEINAETHVGVIERINGQLTMSIREKKSLGTYSSKEINIPNTTNSLAISTGFELSSPINSIKEYLPGGLILTYNNRYMLTFVGKNSDNNLSEFFCDEFDKTTNELLSGFRICELANSPCGIYVSRNGNVIEVRIYKIAGTNLDNLLQSVNTSLLTLGNKTDKLENYDPEYWITSQLKLSNPETVEISISELEKLDSIKLDKNISSHASLLNRYPTLNTILGYFTYDKQIFYPFAKKYYSESVYAGSDVDFKQQILLALFNAVYNNISESNRLYIPIDYVFEYYCNSNNVNLIYGSVSDIIVNYINVYVNKNNISSLFDNSMLLATITGENQTCFLNYFVEYDNENNDVVFSINVQKKYTLPYINADNYWVIDVKTTNVLAKGINAGNPNIIIYYNENRDEDGGKVICGANKEFLETLNWNQEIVYIQPIEQINVNDPKMVTENDLLKLFCRVPELKEEYDESYKDKYINHLKFSLIINVSSVNCFNDLNDEIKEKYGRYGMVATVWFYDEESNKFKVVENPEFSNSVKMVAMDLTTLTNINNVVKYHMKSIETKNPDKFKHKWLVFDNAAVGLKNSVSDNSANIYPVLMNELSTSFMSQDYFNDLNFVVKYQDVIEGANDNNISNISDSNALKFLTENTVTVTSSLYTYPGDGGRTSNYQEYVPNVNMPTLNLKEVLTQNQNLVNRANIISFNKQGKMFYSYIGTSFEDDDKTNVRVGTSSKNINFGTDTMVTPNDEIFQKATKFNVDFDETFINGDIHISKSLNVIEDVNINHLPWTIKSNSVATTRYTNYVPISRMIFDTIKVNTAGTNYSDIVCSVIQFNNTTPENGKTITQNQLSKYYDYYIDYVNSDVVSPNDAKLWISCFYIFTQPDVLPNRYLYLGEGLFLPSLLKHLGLTQFSTKIGLKNIDLTTNREVIKYNDTPMIIMTENKFINGVSTGVSGWKNGEPFIGFPTSSSELFMGNPLDITYYISNNKLKINIIDSGTTNKVRNLFKLQTLY